MAKKYIIDFEEFEDRCAALAATIKKNKDIQNIYGVMRGGMFPAVRISYLTGLPMTFKPTLNHTAIIEDVQETGATRHSFEHFNYFFPLVDKQAEGIKDWVEFYYEK